MKRKKDSRKHRTISPCKDHLGNSYPSIKEMCKVYSINPEDVFSPNKSLQSVGRRSPNPPIQA